MIIKKSLNNPFIEQFFFDQILPCVSKPGRYIGNEVNMIRKDLDQIDVRVALVFPDVYEVGMSYLGFPILYHILNQQSGIYAERVFAPWVDMETLMRRHHLPLLSLETFTPLSQFDVIGFTLQYELHATTILNMLDLAGIPQWSKERSGFPLVIAGGPSAFNPEPVADFFDAILIGDGEEAVVEIAEVVRTAKRQGLNRRETLRRLAGIQGVYVPEFYQPRYDSSGLFCGMEVVESRAPKRVKARIVPQLESRFYPARPLVPVVATTHDRVALEVARGCSRGCRFCNAGIIYRPVRERSVDDLVEQACRNIEATGYDEVSLVSLSTSDFSQLGPLMSALHEKLNEKMVNISFPSLRPERFTPDLAQYAKGVRKSGLTLAPEAGSERLRQVINKTTTTEEIMQAVDLAFREGWKLIKLYFMIGLPTESDEDLDAMVQLIGDISRMARRYRGTEINVSISPFVPKPFTSFQWMAQDPMETTHRKIGFLQGQIRFRNVKLSWRPADVAAVEGILARGDRRLSAVIHNVWKKGANLEGWSEHFNYQYWAQAFTEHPVDVFRGIDAMESDRPLPWDHFEKGVSKKFLREELALALGQVVTTDCRIDRCHECGLMSQAVCRDIIQGGMGETKAPVDTPVRHRDMPVQEAAAERIARIHYSRGPEIKFLSHLDMIRLLTRALRRGQVPVVYSQGFNPKPRMSFAPPLPTGYTSAAEYVDIHVYDKPGFDIVAALADQLPLGMEILDVKMREKPGRSLAAFLNRVEYSLQLPGECFYTDIDRTIQRILAQSEIIVAREKEGREKQFIDVRPYLVDCAITPGGISFTAKMENGHSISAHEVLCLFVPGERSCSTSAQVCRARMYVCEGENNISPMDYQ
jgi:radical SAM family uncharacterized protein/radical SAM-linked protein